MERVVIGIDGSAGAGRALRWAASACRGWEARLTIVHCYPAEVDVGVGTSVDAHDADALLRDAAAQAADVLSDVRWDAVAEWAPSGSVAYALADAADDADLLVVGSRGLGGFLQLLLGSVSHHVSTNSRTSVVVHRGPSTAPPTAVVVGVDGSPPSLTALRWGARAAARLGVPVTAVIAYPTAAAHVAVARGVDPATAAAARDRAHAAATRVLAAAVERADIPEDIPVEQVAAAGSPAGVLVSMARPDQLLVAGPRGRGTVGRLVLGSVTDQCLRHARGPVAVIRHHASAAVDAGA